MTALPNKLYGRHSRDERKRATKNTWKEFWKKKCGHQLEEDKRQQHKTLLDGDLVFYDQCATGNDKTKLKSSKSLDKQHVQLQQHKPCYNSNTVLQHNYPVMI